jgi:NADPH-dependent 2,4-dienoyl-CoA reductase/sulfur reductase-like enzyme
MSTSATPASRQAGSPSGEKVLDARQTTCCVVGGGPGGAVLALLLARKGVTVTLLEAHGDFEGVSGATPYTHRSWRT